MKKETQMPERFHVFCIEYTNGCKSLAYAESYAIDVGDRVITTFGEGTVKMKVQYITPEDEWFRMILSISTVDRITHKIVEVQ